MPKANTMKAERNRRKAKRRGENFPKKDRGKKIGADTKAKRTEKADREARKTAYQKLVESFEERPVPRRTRVEFTNKIGDLVQEVPVVEVPGEVQNGLERLAGAIEKVALETGAILPRAECSCGIRVLSGTAQGWTFCFASFAEATKFKSISGVRGEIVTLQRKEQANG